MLRPFRRSHRPPPSSKKYKPRPFARLDLDVLEDRSLLAVTSALSGGVLTVTLNATDDAATLAVSGSDITVTGGTTASYAIASVNSINVLGTTGDTQTVTINAGVTLPGTFTASAVETVAFGGGVTFGARSTLVSHAMAVTGAHAITVGAGATLHTRSFTGDVLTGDSTANSGGLSFAAKSITVGAGARILTHASTGFQAGDIALRAKDQRLDLSMVPFFNDKQTTATVSIDANAVLKGRNITLTTEADSSRLSLWDLAKFAVSPPTLPSQTITTGLDFVPGAADASSGPMITRSSGSWATDGFAADKTIFVSGTPDGKNDGTYDVAEVSADGKSLVLVTSNALREQSVAAGTGVKVGGVNTDLAPGDVQFVAVDRDGNAVSSPQKQSDIQKSAAPPVSWNPVLDFLGGLPRPVQVSLTTVTAKTTIGDGATIDATGNVEITSKAVGKTASSLPSVVFGVSWAESDVQAHSMIGKATLTAAGSLTLTSEVENELEAEIEVLGGSVVSPLTGDPVQIPGPSIAITVARGNTVSRAETADGTVITAGGVTVGATMANKFVNEASAKTSQAKSLAGSIGVVVANHSEEATATLRGTVTSDGDVEVTATGENQAVENRVEASVNNEDPESSGGSTLDAFNSIREFLSDAKDKNQDDKSENDQSQEGESGTTLQIAGGVVIAFSDLTTKASVGDNAVVTVNGGKLVVAAESESAPQASAVGSAEANSKYAVGGAFIYADYSVDTQAWIGAKATVNVDREIEVTAASSQIGGFPVSVGDFVGGLLGLRDTGLPWVSDGSTTSFDKALEKSSDFVDAIQGILEKGQALYEDQDYSSILQEFASSFVSASAQPGEVKDGNGNTQGKSYAASGNFDLVFAKSHATAWIGEGATINANTPNAEATQSVKVEATTEAKSLTFGGFKGQGSPFDYTSAGGEGAIGGVYAHHDHDMLAKAYVADGVRIDAKADVEVNAENDLIVIAWDFAGASGKGFGVQGTFTVTPVTGTTHAYIEDTAVVNAGGNLTVAAAADNLFITFTGALAESQKIAVGAGLGYFDLDVDTKAFVGNVTTSATYTTAGTVTVGGDAAVTAASDSLNVVVAVSGALSRTPGEPEPEPPPSLEDVLDDGATLTNLFADPDESQPTNTKQQSGATQGDNAKKTTGFGLSASLGLNLVSSVTYAGIDGVTVTVTGNLGVDAKSDELYVVATGAASLNLNAKADSSIALAGAVSWNDLDRDVIAKVNNATISAADVSVTAAAENLLVSVTAGAAVTSPAQKSGSSVGIAGSANINDLDTTVSATVIGTTKITATGDVTVAAANDMIVVSIAGSIGVSQRAGIGAAFDFGFTAQTVEARVADNVTISADGDVSITADNSAAFVSIGASIAAGVGTKGTPLGLAGSASWTNYTTTVAAAVGNGAKVTAGGDMKVLADEELFAFGLGGAAALSSGAAVGAAVAGLNISRTVTATIGNNATISVAGSTAAGDHGLFVGATTADSLYLFGAGGAVGTKSLALAGSLSLLIDNTTTTASIGSSTTVSQPAGLSDHTMSVFVTADHDSSVLTVAGAFALGKSAGIGFGVVVMPMTHVVTASIASSASVSANDDVRVRAFHAFDTDTVAAALSGGISGVGVAGAGAILPLNFTTTATVGTSAVLRANGNIVVTADSEFDELGIAGQGAFSAGGTAVGVSNVTTVRTETVRAEVGNFASLTALGNKGTFAAADDAASPKNVRGLIVTSTLDDDIIAVAAGAAGGASGTGVAGSAAVTVQTTNVVARLGTGVSVNANPADRTAANAAQDVYLYAEHLADFAGAGGGAGFGSSGGVGVGVDVGTINRTTQAIIDGSANVYAKGDVYVRAVAGGDWISVAASLGGGGTAGIAGSASIQVHTITTQARIGNLATVYAVGNVVVTAKDELQIDGVAGQISIGGTAGVGGSVPVVVVTKTTDASIGNNAVIDALGNTSAFQAHVAPPSVSFTDPLFFGTSAVSATNNTVNLGYAHGFQTGDSVTYWANGGTDIGGLSNGGTYYAVVVDATTIKLATSEANAKAGTVIDLTSAGTGTQQSITAYGEVAAPAVNNSSATGDQLTKQRKLSLGSTGVRGVVVSSISIDDYATYGISGGGGGTVGVQIVASVSIPTITTTATVGTGAQINQADTGANAGQSVNIAAIADYDRLGIGGSLAIGGTAGIAPLADVLVSKHTTKAVIGANASVGAERDINVTADASEEVRAFVIGVAGAGTAAVAGSVGVIVLKTQTQAILDLGVTAFAGGNVIVAANDQTDATVVVGSVALGLGAAGVGASVNVSVIEKDTLARIANDAKATALANGSSVNAYTGDGVTKAAVEGVIVQAVSDEDILNVVVAGGAGLYAGVAGAVNVNVLTANTVAQVGGNVTINGSGTADADQSFIVAAIDKLDLDVVGGAAGLGAAGVAGSVDVGVIRSNTNASVGAGTAAKATKDISIGSAAVRDVDSVIIGASGGLGALAASVAVYSLYATVDTASKNSLNGSGGNNGATYADSATSTSVISNGLGGYNQSSTFEGGKQLAATGNSAKTSVVNASPSGLAAGAVNATVTPSGTSATVGTGTLLQAGGNVSVLTSDSVAIDATTGSIAVGAAGIGAGVTYVTVGGQSLATIGDNATLIGTNVKVSAGYGGDADARAYGGGAGGFVGVGAQVAILTDQHNETASVGNGVTVTATTKFTQSATGTRTLDTSNAGGGVSAGFSAGASYAQIDAKGTAAATYGTGGKVTAGTGGVSITSSSTIATDANAVGVAAGAVAINLTLAEVKVSGGATATVGSGTKVTSAGDMTVTATYTSTTDLDAVGVTGAVFSVGAMDVKYTDTSFTTAALNGIGTSAISGNITVLASADNTVTLDAVGTSVGGVAGNGAGVTVVAGPTVNATATSTGVVTAGKSISVVGRAGGEFDADTTGVNVGGVAVGVSIISIGWTPNVSATVGAGSTFAAAEDLTVRSFINHDAAGNAQTGKTVDVGVVAVAGGLAAGSAAVVAVNMKTTTATTIGTGASLSATNSLRVGSDQRTRTDVNLTAVNVGFVAGGAVFGDVRVHASSTVTLPDSTFAAATRLAGGRGVTVKAGFDHGGRANVRGGAGGLFGAAAGARFNYELSGPDTASNTDTLPLTVSVGKNAVISSAGTTDIGTFHRIDFESDSFLAGIGGLGTAVNSDLTTISHVNAAVTIGESAKIGTRNLRISTDQNVRSDTDTDAQAYAGLGASTNTDSTSRYYATNAVTVNTGAVIVATGAATVENANGNVYVRADSYARGVSFVADVEANSHGTRRMNNSVTVASGTEIITPRLAVQSLRPTGGFDVTADSTNVSAVGFFISIWNAITGGNVGRNTYRDGNEGGDLVNLNAAITLGSPRNVQLYIDANGGITKQNWPTVVIEPTRIVVDDIFTAQPERLDVRAPNGVTMGASTVTYGPMETITIENASKRTLFLRNIDTYSNGINTPVYNHEGGTRTWTYTESKSTVTNGENTVVNIRNTAVGTATGYDVQLSGRIDVVAGTVNVTANGGDVYSMSANGYINSRAVTLNATAGSLGKDATPIFIRTPEQANTALPVGIQSAHGETGGHLNVNVTSPTASAFSYRLQNITSNTGTMKIVANEGSKVARGITTEVQLSNGTAYQGTVLGLLTFDPANAAQFSAANDTITLPFAHGLTTGDRVTYQPIGFFPVGGIVPWVEREVKVIDAKTIQFSTAFDTNNVSTAKDTISFATPHGIQTGEAVVYDKNGGTAVGGMTSGTTYNAWAYDDTTVQLYDSAANAGATGNKFFANAVQHIKNPGYDAKATSGLATLEYLDVIAMSAVNTFTTGTKIQYWTHDSNALRLWTGTGTGVKYWTNTLSYEPSLKSTNPDVKYAIGDQDDPANPNEDYTSTAAANDSNYVTLPTLTYFYAVEVPNPDGKEEYKGLIALASSAQDATDGVLTKLTTPAAQSQELHYLRSTAGLVNITSAPTNQPQALRSDLTAPAVPGATLHIIDTNGVYVQDAKGAVTRVTRTDVRSIREVVAETLTTPAGTTTTVNLGAITSTAGSVLVEVGTSSGFDTEAVIVDTLSAAAGTFKVEVDGGSLTNGTANTNFVANVLDLTTWDNIGSATTPITGKVQFFTAVAGKSGTGGIWFENTGKLTLREMSAVNDISVTVVDLATAGDDLYVDANFTIQSTTGTVELKAGDKLYVPDDAKVNGPGGVNLYVNYGNAEGTAGVIDLRGLYSSTIVNIFGNANTIDTILDDNDMNFEIGDGYLRRYAGKTLDMEFRLFNVTGDHFDLTTGGLDNTITVTDWTGTGIIDAGAGINKIVAVNDADFDLGDVTFSRSGHGDITFVNGTIERARLVGGTSDNAFTVTNWTGQASLDGAGGSDTLADVNDVNYTLSDSFMGRSTAGSFNLWNFERAELTSGGLDNRFEVSEWTGITVLDGGAGINTVASVRDGNYKLSDAELVRTIGGTTAGDFDLTNVTKAVLIGGESDNTFAVSGWTGTAKLVGTTGIDRVLTAADGDGYLTADFLTRADGGQFSLQTIETAVMIGGAGSNAFLIEGWAGSVSVDGGGGGDKLMVNANTDYTLTASSIKLANGTNINVANLTKVTLNGGVEDNTFVIEEQPDFFTVIHGFGGDNQVIVSADADFNLTGSNLALDGTDRYHLADVNRISLVGTQADTNFVIDGWAGDLAVHGGKGTDTVSVVGDANFSLTGGAINLGTGKTVNLYGVENAKLYGGAGDNRFEVIDWAGGVTIYGGGGQDVVTTVVAKNVTLTDGSLPAQDGPSIGLVGVERAVLIGLPGQDHAFYVQNYTGDVSVHGSGTGFDRLVVTSAGSFALEQGHLVLGTGGTIDFTGIDATVLRGVATAQNAFYVGAGTGDVSVVGGNTGLDEITVVADTDFVLDDSAIQLGDGTTITLDGVTKATLVGGAGDNTFDVSGWTGHAVLDGGAGHDTVVSSNDADFVLTRDTLQRSDGAVFSLVGIETVNLTGGSGDNSFIVEEWAGGVNLDGGVGNDDYRVVLDGAGGASAVNISDTGTVGTDTLTVVVPPAATPLVTLHGVWLGDDSVTHFGVEDFVLI
jgi:hypothetical protein